MAAYENTPSSSIRIQELLHSRPALPQLKVGFQVRNIAEIHDLSALVGKIPHMQYVGLAGSRQVGKILIPREKLPKTVTDPLPEPLVEEILDRLTRIVGLVHGCARIAHRPARHTPVPAVNAFMYDMDVVVVPEDPRAVSSVEPRIGVRSGTHFDLITVSEDALTRSDGFFRSAFLNSRRLLFA